ncbi:MAG: CRISPR-associated endonuclease Cas3'', partial [Deferribacteraceae bacterium]|nr:CRISPR-associated endonuclease Cas3'' [Deferribacteraceae bacterium]
MTAKLIDTVLARITKDGREQILHAHAQNVSSYARIFGTKCGIGEIMRIAGSLHDMGKASQEWQEYLKRNNPNEKRLPHSIYGAKHAYDETIAFRCVAELIANIIAAHHGRLYDSIAPDGTTPIIDKLSSADFSPYDHKLDINIDILKNEFMSAITSVEKPDQAFGLSMLTKFAFSCLVDADRLDAYLMEIQELYKAPSMPDWGVFILALEGSLRKKNEHKTRSDMAQQMA